MNAIMDFGTIQTQVTNKIKDRRREIWQLFRIWYPELKDLHMHYLKETGEIQIVIKETNNELDEVAGDG